MYKKQKYKILIVEDQLNIRKILSKRLKSHGYEILTTSNGHEALKLLNFFLPNLIVLDIMLPDISGYEICKRIRKKSDIPIVFLTALSTVGDQIKGLELGANDYIIKPFSIEEIQRRIYLLLERKLEPIIQFSKIEFDEIKIDFKKKILLKNEIIFNLNEIEIKILKVLLSEKNKVFSRKEIINFIWGFDIFSHSDSRIIDVYISKLRNKIEDQPNNPFYIQTIRGIGYKFCEKNNFKVEF
jgi:DNA-binding response OmpR family regulator